MSWYNPDWYYTQVPDEEEDEEERIAAGEEQWERERDADL
jgi:hypothetical protein